MPRMEIEGFEKGTRVRVVGVTELVVLEDEEGVEEQGVEEEEQDFVVVEEDEEGAEEQREEPEVVVEDDESTDEEDQAETPKVREVTRCLGGHTDKIGQEGTVEWTYASDLDGSPWVWVTLDGDRRRRPGDRALAFRAEDLEVLDGAPVEAVEAVETVEAEEVEKTEETEVEAEVEVPF